MFEVTFKCLNSRNQAVNWVKIMTKDEVIDTLDQMLLNPKRMDWENGYTYNFVELASAYRLTIKPFITQGQ